MPARISGIGQGITAQRASSTTITTGAARSTEVVDVLANSRHLDFLLPWATTPVGRVSRRGYGAVAVQRDEYPVQEESGPRAGPRAGSRAGPSRNVPKSRTRERFTEVQVDTLEPSRSIVRSAAISAGLSTIDDAGPSSLLTTRPDNDPPPPRRPPDPTKILFMPLPTFHPQYHPSNQHPHHSSPSPLSQSAPRHSPTASMPLDCKHAKPRHRPLSFIHHHLSKPNPPSPVVLRDHLQHDPSLVTPTSISALSNYARLTGHFGVEAEMNKVGRLINPQSHPRLGNNGKDSRLGRGIERTFANRRPQHWAAKRWYPQVVSKFINDPDKLLCHLHHRLLVPDKGLRSPVFDHAVSSIHRACFSSKRGESATAEALRGVLHLGIIYPEGLEGDWTAMQVLEEFLELCPNIKPTRQTLHLLVQRVLWPCQELLHATTIIHPVQQSNGGTVLAPPKSQPDDVSDVPVISPDVHTDIINLLHHFRSHWNISPGIDTCRNVLAYAGQNNLPFLGKVAFDAGWTALDVENQTVCRFQGVAEGQVPKFMHTGKKWKRWRSALKRAEAKGWARRVEVFDRGRRGRWEWVHRRAEGMNDTGGSRGGG